MIFSSLEIILLLDEKVGVNIWEQSLLDESHDIHLASHACGQIFEMHYFLLVWLQLLVDQLKIRLGDLVEPCLVFDLLEVKSYHVLHEKQQVNKCIGDDEDRTEEEVEHEVHEFVSSASTVSSGIHPGHCQFVEYHFDVTEGPHKYLKGQEQNGGHYKNRAVENQKELLIHSFWVGASHQNWSCKDQEEVEWSWN